MGPRAATSLTHCEDGIAEGFSKGAKTEKDFADALERLRAWWEEEDKKRSPF